VRIAPRSRPQKLREAARATAFAARYRSFGDPRALRRVWLAGRFDLVPSSVDLTSGPVLDVGANAGGWTASLLRLVPGASVIAFEPAPATAETLRMRFAGDSRVRVEEVAVSDRDGLAKFHQTAESEVSSLRKPRDMNAHYGVTTGWEEVAAVEVRTATLDALVAGTADPPLVKIDVQGAEAAVLAGAKATLARSRAVLMELNVVSHYEDDTLAEGLAELMARHGYVEAGRSDPWLDARTGRPLWYDALFVRQTGQ
jgi:FkbM family methyltransferase